MATNNLQVRNKECVVIKIIIITVYYTFSFNPILKDACILLLCLILDGLNLCQFMTANFGVGLYKIIYFLARSIEDSSSCCDIRLIYLGI